MRNLLLIFTLLFSTVVFSSSSYADWTKVTEASNGDDHYLDFERIRQHSGHVYYWVMRDYLKPDKSGYLSDKFYYQGDCKQFRYKGLSAVIYREPMGGGTGESTKIKWEKWVNSNSNNVSGTILEAVCKHIYPKMRRPSIRGKSNLKPMPPSSSSEKKLSPSDSRQELLNIMNKYSPSIKIK
jgi:hypothetical protein